MNRIDRLTAILTQLQSKRSVKAQEIADRFGISLRTVYRDIRSLEEAGVPLLGEAGVGYSFVEGYRLPPVQFTKEEAVACLVAEKIIEKVSDRESSRHFHAAMYKIKALLKPQEKDTVEHLSSQIAVIHQPRKRSNQTLQSLLIALSDRRTVQITYTSFVDENSTQRTLEPVGVYHAYEQWYLIAWCRLRNAYRTFRLDRIHTLSILEESFQANHPSLVEYLDRVAKEEKLQKVVLAVNKQAVKYVKEQRYNHGFVMEQPKEDFVEMTFMTASIEGIARWILMLADQITIYEPDSLKERVKELLQVMLEKINQKRPKGYSVHTDPLK
ncbi:MAG: YafY family transcriptional regulator [Lunatimonas sp.]|uniref:helix-turn-helix transcriptional regulator n=1 Tax=Lunatimonas sp. TaxID=2060141 RepID=UPI00263A9DA6|nr:YafY family protein [Lunatimonas sp.]MCC5937080.1 YafY family transcriptional regulator [Lunatimonas sp.]